MPDWLTASAKFSEGYGFWFHHCVRLLRYETCLLPTSAAYIIDNALGKGCQVWFPFLLLALKILKYVATSWAGKLNEKCDFSHNKYTFQPTRWLVLTIKCEQQTCGLPPLQIQERIVMDTALLCLPHRKCKKDFEIFF